jgi:hypothetical protein
LIALERKAEEQKRIRHHRRQYPNANVSDEAFHFHVREESGMPLS